jgi:hypothetical protein
MDVVLRPIAEAPSEWELQDRLGRDLGKVTQSADPEAYKIVAALMVFQPLTRRWMA